MSTVLAVYYREPHFPASDQHPEAQRYFIDNLYVDALEGEPTSEEVAAVWGTDTQ